MTEGHERLFSTSIPAVRTEDQQGSHTTEGQEGTGQGEDRTGMRTEGSSAESATATTGTGSSGTSGLATFNVAVTADLERAVDQYKDGSRTKIQSVGDLTRIIDSAEGIDENRKQVALDQYIDTLRLHDRQNDVRGSARTSRIEGDDARSEGCNDETEGERRRRGECGAARDEKRGQPDVERVLQGALKAIRRADKEGRRDETEGSESDDDDDPRGPSNKKRRLYFSELSWCDAESEARERELGDNQRNTRAILDTLAKDYVYAEKQIRTSAAAPRGFPLGEWKHIIRGEPVNLDAVYSSIHHLAPVKENVGRIGRHEISLGTTDPVRKVQTMGNWIVAWRAASKATAFVFPHRRHELEEWGEHIEDTFTARVTGSHSRVIAYDRAVRDRVQGGQAVLLNDWHKLQPIRDTYLLPDGADSGQRREFGENTDRRGLRNWEICRRFNTRVGCHSSADGCRYRHACLQCGRTGHGKEACSEQGRDDLRPKA